MDNKNKMLINIHIPFCRGRCVYCDRLSFGQNIGYLQRYLRALEKELSCAGSEMEEYEIRSVLLQTDGLSLMGVGGLDDFLHKAEAVIPHGPDTEWSAQLLPDDLTEEYLYVLGVRHHIRRILLRVGACRAQDLRQLHTPWTENLVEHAFSFLSHASGTSASSETASFSATTSFYASDSSTAAASFRVSDSSTAAASFCVSDSSTAAASFAASSVPDEDSQGETLASGQNARLSFLVDVELVFGIPGQTLESFEDDLSRILSFHPAGIILRRFHNNRLTPGEQRSYAEETDWFSYISAARELFAGAGYVEEGRKLSFALPGLLRCVDHTEAGAWNQMGFGIGAVTRLDGLAYRNTSDYSLYLEHADDPSVIAEPFTCL